MPARYDVTRAELADLFAGEPGYRLDQVWHGLYQELVEPESMTALPTWLRTDVAAALPSALTLVTDRLSDRGDTLKLLFELAGPTFDPDLVVVNLYLGNDGPDLVARPRSFRRVPSSLRKSYLARYVVNVVRVATGVDRHVVAEAVSLPRWSPPPHARGGEIVDATAPLRPDDRQLTGPIYTQERFPGIMWDEYRRFARSGPRRSSGGTARRRGRTFRGG